jgi:triacylglycerol esterase/lipase EstA (alpha/beta hydrolase family)
MLTIEQKFKRAFEKVEQQIQENGAANTDDVKTLQMWQALLGVKYEANRPNEAIPVGNKSNS